MQVMSFNVRYINPWDEGKRSWDYRRDLVIDTIRKQKADIIGFQEVKPLAYEFLKEQLKEYDSINTWREACEEPEGNPVFYKEELFTLVDKGSFWLSETPEVMSIDWGAGCYRICSYVILIEKATEKKFVVFNTHLDNVSEEARIKGINVILSKMVEFGSLPAILMGDFNAEEDSETYKSATTYLLDTRLCAKETMKSHTFHNWGSKEDEVCIDYMLTSKTGFNVNSYKVVTDTYDGVFVSDHYQLSVNLELAE